MANRILIGLLVLVLTSATLSAAPRHDRCVILISVDGLAGFYLDDPRADLPTIRRLAKAGVRADGLVCSFPTVTWPNHTTLVTGVPPAKHGVLGNNYLDRTSQSSVGLIVDPLFDKEQIVKSPTVYDAAHQAGLVTAGVLWPASRNARTLDWTVPDMPGNESWQTYGTQVWLEELQAAGVPIEKHEGWCKEKSGGVQRDWLYTRMVKHLFEHHPPNLLMVHLIEVDHVQHNFGPRTPEAYWAVSYADDRVRDIVEAARASKFGDNVTVVVASDHGFFPIEKTIRPNVRLRELGLIADVDGKTQRQAMALSQGGACMIYILDEANRAAISQQLREELAKLEGVADVIAPDRFASLGVARPEDDPRAPDLWLEAKSGYSFDNADKGLVVEARETLGGAHGYSPAREELYGTLVISGAGVRPAGRLGRVQSLDVAPTIAELLGVELPTADGKAIGASIAN
jgi:predicted AlkP superfamily pyrophosphatase or phosphodiesterase